jgi:hypothetical protein
MAFDANGVLLEVSDGGVYKRTSARDSTGNWFSLNGDIQTSEVHSMAYDPISGRVFGGLQDNGSNRQTSDANRIFQTVLQGDGGDAAVEVVNPTTSVRYTSAQNLRNFIRQTCDSAGTCGSTVAPALTPIDGSPLVSGQFVTPIQTNRFGPSRLVFGGANGVYESTDRGDTVSRLSATLVIPGIGGTPIIYGLPNNPDYLMIGAGGSVLVRTAAPPATLALIATLPQVNDLTIDPVNPRRMFAVSNTSVWFSNNRGASFTDVSGNLPSLGTTSPLRAVLYVTNADPALVIGGINGVYVARASSNFSLWQRLSTGFPQALVFELDYNPKDGTLVAATLGRGVWRLRPFLPDLDQVIFRDGFEP